MVPAWYWTVHPFFVFFCAFRNTSCLQLHQLELPLPHILNGVGLANLIGSYWIYFSTEPGPPRQPVTSWALEVVDLPIAVCHWDSSKTRPNISKSWLEHFLRLVRLGIHQVLILLSTLFLLLRQKKCLDFCHFLAVKRKLSNVTRQFQRRETYCILHDG